MSDYFGVNNYSASGINLGSFNTAGVGQGVSQAGAVSNVSTSGLGMVGAFSGAIGSILGTMANVSAIKNRSAAIINKIEAETNSFLFETSVIEQQRKEVNRELGDMMTDVGLQGLEAEAKVRAMNASRGVSGSSVNEASINVAMKQNLANADLINKARNTDITLLRRELAKKIEFDNKTSALASGISSTSSSALGVLTGGVQGFASGLSLVSPQERTDFYNTTTSYVKSSSLYNTFFGD